MNDYCFFFEEAISISMNVLFNKRRRKTIDLPSFLPKIKRTVTAALDYFSTLYRRVLEEYG